jgi:hypothetical protein
MYPSCLPLNCAEAELPPAVHNEFRAVDVLPGGGDEISHGVGDVAPVPEAADGDPAEFVRGPPALLVDAAGAFCVTDGAQAYVVVTLTMRPTCCDADKAENAARQQLNVPFKSISTMVRQPFGESFSVSHTKLPAALLIRMSSAPARSTTWPITLSTIA